MRLFYPKRAAIALALLGAAGRADEQAGHAPSDTDSDSRQRAWLSKLAPFALILLSLLAYSNSFTAGFTLDSRTLVLEDPRVHAITVSNLWSIFSRTYWDPSLDTTAYRPLVTLSWLANYAGLGNGTWPFGYHAVNFSLHAVNLVLLYLLGLTVLARSHWPTGRSQIAAFFTALLFGVHAVGTEAVTNIAGRADLMAGAAVLAGLLIHTRAQGTAPFGLLAAAVAGMASKESAILLLPGMLLYDICFRPLALRRFSWLAGRYALAGGGIGVVLFARYLVRSTLLSTVPPFLDNPILGANLAQGKLTAIVVLWRYVRLIVWPAELSADYSFNQIPMATLGGDWWALLLLFALIPAFYLLWRRSRVAFFWGAFFFLAILPASNLPFTLGTVMAERLLYLPMAGAIGCGVTLLLATPRASHTAAAALLVVLAMGLGARTWQRNLDWHDDLSLWSSTARTSPNSFKAQSNLAVALTLTGTAEDLDLALRAAERAVAIVRELPLDRKTSQTQYVLGTVWERRARQFHTTAAFLNALDAYDEAVGVDKAQREQRHRSALAAGRGEETLPMTGNFFLWYRRAATLQELGRFYEATESVRMAMRIDPRVARSFTLAAEIAARQGRMEDALDWALQSYLLEQSPAVLAKIETYAGSHAGGCEVQFLDALNLRCGPLRDLVCRSERKLVQSLLDYRFPELAAVYQRNRITGERCGSEPE